MTDVFAPEIEILREQFSDAAKRYPGLQCYIATWPTSNKEPVFCNSGKQADSNDYFIPKELLYTPQALIYRWNHSPCSAEELVDPLPPDYDEDDDEPRDLQHLPIANEDFASMATYGSTRLRCAVLISKN